MQQKILADDMKLALMTNKALSAADVNKQKELGLDDKVEVALRFVRPKQPLDLMVLAFNDQEKLTAAFELGRLRRKSNSNDLAASVVVGNLPRYCPR